MKQRTLRAQLGILAVTAGAVLAGVIFVFALAVFAPAAFAFVGPSQSPPAGNGAISSDASNNVAVGTSTTISGTKLEVVGATSDNTTYAAKFVAANGTPIFFLRSDGSVSISTSTASAGNTVVGGNLTVGGVFTAGALSGSLTAGNVSSGQFGSNTGGGNYYFSGALGVGGSPTLARLEIDGNGTGANIAGASLDLNELGVRSWYIGAGRSVSGKLTIGSGSGGDALTIDGAGNVGIGTASPASTLQVVGAITASSINSPSSQGITLYGGGNGSQNIFLNPGSGSGQVQIGSGGLSVSANSVGTLSNIQTITPNNPIAVAAAYGSGSNYVPGLIWYMTDQNPSKPKAGIWEYQDGSGSKIQFGTSNSYATGITNTAMTIDPNGKVGIGTTTPSYALDVNGTASFEGNIIHGVGTPVATTDAANKSYVDAAVTGGSGPWTLSGSNVYTSNTSYNVGIGTTSPTGHLSVYDTAAGDTNIYFQKASPGTGAMYVRAITPSGNAEFIADNGSRVWGFGNEASNWTVHDWTASTIPVTVEGAAPSNSLYIKSSGNVGIGTTNPATQLQVSNPTAGGTTAITVDAGSYPSTYRTQLGAQASAQGVLILGNNGPNDIRFGNTTTGGYGNIYVNNTVDYGTAANGTLAATFAANGVVTFPQPVYVGTPTAAGMAATKSYVDSAVAGGSGSGSFSTLTVTGNWTISGAAQSNLNMNNLNINSVNTLNVNKINATTLDPVYQIGGTNYATFAPSAIGVNEEVTGSGTLAKAGSEYQYAIDFSKLAYGSDLWVWYQAVDFGKDTVDAVATPYGRFAEIYYTISGSTITFHGDAPAQFTFQLTGKRFDWKQWPTRIVDQSAAAGLVVPVK